MPTGASEQLDCGYAAADRSLDRSIRPLNCMAGCEQASPIVDREPLSATDDRLVCRRGRPWCEHNYEPAQNQTLIGGKQRCEVRCPSRNPCHDWRSL